jgi:multicomponent Na+:H+ antiporter subunit A
LHPVLFVWLILGTFGTAAVAPWLHRRAGERAGWLLATWPLLIVVAAVGRLVRPGCPAEAAGWDWAPTLGLRVGLYVDGLSLLMILLVAGIGALVLVYGGGYLKGDGRLGRFYAQVLLFMGAMLGVAAAGDLISLFVFWELTSVASFLLIGFNHADAGARSAARQALLVTGAGGLALLAGGSFEIAQLAGAAAAIRSHGHYGAILLLVVLGAATKSAQAPFHFWLPGAMAAPTPVSAYLHSATMVKAGVYLLARLAPVLGGTAEWHYLLTLLGVTTMLLGALMALGQTDLKRLLAYSTVSMLGLLVLLLGLDTKMAVEAALVILVVHSLYKGALFMVAGAVDHETGTRNVQDLGGLIRCMPVTAFAAGLAALSMSGFPPLLGYIGKELLYEAKLQVPGVGWLILGAGVLANALNVAVALTVGIRPFLGRPGRQPAAVHEAPPALLTGPALMAVLGLVFGLVPGVLAGPVIAPAAAAVHAQATEIELKLWHGVNAVLLLSLATVAAGVGLFAVRQRARRLGERLALTVPFTPSRIYGQLLEGLLDLAKDQTRILQHGRLRGYIFTVLAGAVVATAWSAWGYIQWTRPARLAPVSPVAVVVGVLVVAAALAAVRAASRLGAVLALGGVGFGVSLLYVVYGAPDLAVTQLLVETLTMILFVLVLPRLPRLREFSASRQRWRDGCIAAAVGITMTGLVWQALQVQLGPAISEFYARSSVPLAFGRNVVNVILVDFRALDTLGEITVLAVAALGAVYLLQRCRPPQEGPP